MTIFDLLSGQLMLSAVGLALLRVRHEQLRPLPYVIIGLISLVGNYLGERGGGAAAVCLLIAGAFLVLHIASQPYHERLE